MFVALQVCNNLVLGVSMAAVAEGLALGQRLGLDPKLLSDIFNNSSARCWSSDSNNPCPVGTLKTGVTPTRGFGCFLCLHSLRMQCPEILLPFLSGCAVGNIGTWRI